MRARLLPRVVAVAAAVLGVAAAGWAASDATTDPVRQDRARGWAAVQRLVLANAGPDQFLEGWRSRTEAFAASDANARPPAWPFDIAEHGPMDLQSGEAEVLISAHYNAVAFSHIRDQHLNDPAALQRLRASRSQTIAPFPVGAAVALAAWWPVAAQGLTPLPVWDAQDNPAGPLGNGYASWARIVAIDPADGPEAGAPAAMTFLGQEFPLTHRVGLSRFVQIAIDDAGARALMGDLQARKAALIALGRPLRGGDRLALVAMHLASKEDTGWVWSTLWWHDRPADTVADVPAPWTNYWLDAVSGDGASDAAGPPRPCFNPWFEARFPAGAGGGGGVSSNCAECHRRASYPAVSFLTVRRPPRVPDPALDPTQLRTDFQWAIARHTPTKDR